MAIVTTTEMFKKAYDGGYAIGAFNVNNMEIIQGITEAAMEEKAPLILQVSSGARKYAKMCIRDRPILEADGLIADLLETREAGEARKTVAERAGEFQRIVCIGGDGTLNEVVSGMLDAGRDVPIGYVPAGSTNDFAASHGISRDLLRAARDVVEGEAMPMDVGAFNGRCFVYTASFGVFTRASYAAPQTVKNAVGHLAYVFEGIRDLAALRPYTVRVEGEEEGAEGEFIFGMAGNSTSMGLSLIHI